MGKVKSVKVNEEFFLQVTQVGPSRVDMSSYSEEAQWAMIEGKNVTQLGKGLFIKHKFDKSYAGKKVCFTAYYPSNQEPWDNTCIITCYIEKPADTKIRVAKVKGPTVAIVGKKIHILLLSTIQKYQMFQTQ